MFGIPLCVCQSHDYGHTPLSIVMEFGIDVLYLVQGRSDVYTYKDIFTPLLIENGGSFVGLFRSYTDVERGLLVVSQTAHDFAP